MTVDEGGTLDDPTIGKGVGAGAGVVNGADMGVIRTSTGAAGVDEGGTTVGISMDAYAGVCARNGCETEVEATSVDNLGVEGGSVNTGGRLASPLRARSWGAG